MTRTTDSSGGTDGGVAALTLALPDADALQAEYAANLGAGRAFVPGVHAVRERDACELVLVHPESGASLTLSCEAVFVEPNPPNAGVGLMLLDRSDEGAARLRAFVDEGTGETAEKPLSRSGDDGGGGGGAAEPENVYLRVKRYDTSQQLRAAREGDYTERVALERVYGKAVWDVLLHNPRITAPEITRMARNPKLPKHLLETITGNPGWLASAELRRSLLKNPALAGACLDKVLRAMPKPELTLVAKQSSYPMAVRQAIKRMQGR